MLSKTEINKVFPNLQGRGLEIKKDVSNIFCYFFINGDVSDKSYHLPLMKRWEEDYPEYMCDMVYNNFVAPLLANDITEEEQRKIIGRLDLFCASIL
tara:strand:+ start:816 stop:1106 length:291 start_codon:yes stop_codon:yes gene_type:complete